MTIKIGDRLPEGALAEFIETATEGCSLGPNTFKVGELIKGKKIAIFGLPGAYTPTCSAQHVPGYVKHVLGFRQFSLRGLAAMRSEWRLMCAVHNLLKLWRHTQVAAAG